MFKKVISTFVIAAFILTNLLMSPVFIKAESAGITIDGNASDWANINPVATASGQDATSLKVYHDSTYLYFCVQGSNVGTKTSFFIDSDNNSSTGYMTNTWSQSGCDYMVENYALFSHPTNDSSWNWTSLGGTDVSLFKNSSVVELRVPKAALTNLSSIFRVGYKDISSTWLFKGALPSSGILPAYDHTAPLPTPTPTPIPTPMPKPALVTLGYTDDGDTISKIGANSLNAVRYQAASSMTANTINARIGTGAAGSIKCAIYSDNAGSPGSLLKGTDVRTNVGTGWQAFNLTSPLDLISGSYYWLVIWTNDSKYSISAQGNQAGELKYTHQTYGAWPSAFATELASADIKYSLYVSTQPHSNNLFPKIANISIGAKAGYTDAASHAKYDVDILGMWKGWGGGTSAIRKVVQDIKTLHPDILIGKYTILGQNFNNPNNTATRDIYDKIFSEKGPNGIGDWWARDNLGNNLTWYWGTWDINITNFVKPDANGDYFSEWLAKRENKVFFEPIPEFDIWYNDNTFYRPRIDADWDGDGINNSKDSPEVRKYYREGIARYFEAARKLQPDRIMFGNVDGQPGHIGYLNEPEYKGKLGGALYENAIGKGYSTETWSTWENMIEGYHDLMANTVEPHTVIFSAFRKDPADYKIARYSIGSALLNDGYISISDINFNSRPWFDEYDLAGTASSKWLGEAVDGPQMSPWSEGVYMRRFENGLVLVNPKGNGTRTVTIEPGYKRFLGVQDPVINNGQPVTTITLDERDAILLQVDEVDRVAPVTSAAVEGTLNNGWFASDVKLTLTAVDKISEVIRTEYSMDGGATWLNYSTPVILSDSGVYNILYRSTDELNNVEQAKTLSVQIDRIAPTYLITVNGASLPDGAVFEDAQALSFDLTAQDNLSGVDGNIIAIDGQNYIPGTVLDFAGKLGTHVIEVTITDKAGNITTANISFEVETSIASIRQLLERYQASGNQDGPLVPQLINSLDQAEHQLKKGSGDMAAKHMEDFLKHLENKTKDGNISDQAEAVLAVDANALILLWK